MYDFPSLNKLRDETSKLVIGQENLINKVSLCLYKHLLRILSHRNVETSLQQTTNLLITGKSGTGKTFTVRSIAEKLGLPVIEINAKSICQEGWAGKSFIDLLEKGLLSFQSTRFWRYIDYAVVFIDEFDKLIIENHASNNENVSYHLQAGILKYLEGMTINIKAGQFDTSNFCFILAGAFNDIYVEEAQAIGFNENAPSDFNVTNAFIKFGMMPELAGRITSFVKTNDFTPEMYRDLLCNENMIFNKWLNYLRYLGLNASNFLNYSAIISEANKRDLGARGLIQILDEEIDKILEENKDKLDILELFLNIG